MKSFSHLIILLTTLLFNSCQKWKFAEVPLEKYQRVYIGGLAGQTFEFYPDSTFRHTFSTCLTRTIIGGKYSVLKKEIKFYDVENLSTPFFYDMKILNRSLVVSLPNGNKSTIIKNDTIIVNEMPVPPFTYSKAMFKNKRLYFFNNTQEIVWSLPLFNEK